MTDTQIGNFFNPVYGKKLRVQTPPLKVNERVIWPLDSGPQAGTVRWVGLLPDVGNDWTAGVELDNPVGNNDGAWGNLRLFTTKPSHGLIISIAGLIKEDEFLGKPSDLQYLNSGTGFLQPTSQNIFNCPLQNVVKKGLINKDSLAVGERIVWIDEHNEPQHGIIRWMGLIDNDPNVITGVEFDNPIGNGVGFYKNVQYFNAKFNHASFIPLVQLLGENDYLMSLPISHNYLNSIEMAHNQKRFFEGTYDNFHWNSVSYGSDVKRCITKESNESLPASIYGNQADRLFTNPVCMSDSLSDVEVNKILRQLELAISRGHTEEASQLAHKLAMHKISCSIIRKKPRLKPSSDEEFFVNIFVEDRSSHIGPFILYIKPLMSVGELKRLVEKEFDFPAAIQRWILGKKLATDDNATLLSYGIVSNGCPVFLYLMTTDVEKITVYRKRLSNYLDALERLEEEAEEDDLELNINSTNKIDESNDRVDIIGIDEGEEDSNPNSVSQENKNCKTSGKNQLPENEGWPCPVCTLVNAPTRPGCSACTTSRPEDYVIPLNYKVSEEEELRLLQEKAAEESAKKAREEERLRNYQELIEIEDADVIFNNEPFECPICFNDIEEHEGIILRDCVHMFCRDCLNQTIEHSETAEVKCPFMNDEYSCPAFLQEREIKVLVTPEVYERHLQRSMTIAESQAENSFHCKTKDCHSWCLYEDNINEFYCPVCKHLNCLTCRVIHEGLNCHQYQEKLELESSQNEEAQKTKAYFDEMLLKGQAMRCPQCQIILMKKWGCDWLQCTMCRTEICWVTKGRRWGPKGHGDTSAGCRCGLNGKRCHALCNYCH